MSKPKIKPVPCKVAACGVAFKLTPREIEVLRLRARDVPCKQVADELGIHVGTVSFHMQNIFAKLLCRSCAGVMGKLLGAAL